MIERYAFYGQAAKLHEFYDGSWSENIKTHNTAIFNKLVDIAVAKGYHPDIAAKDITGWVKLADPACADYDERYRAVSTTKKSKDWALVESLTLPGLMASIIEEAKTSKARYISRSHRGAAWMKQFIVPGKEWYHPMFAKDLYEVKPEWCEYGLSDDEQKELLVHMISKGKIPTGADPWIVSKEHPLAKFKGTLRPLPAKSFKAFGKKDLIISKIEQDLKKGIKPKEWNWLEYNYANDAQQLSKKYPEVVNKQNWYRENLTEPQQKQLEGWMKVEQLVSTNETDEELMSRLDSKDKMLVGNHFKQLDAERSHKNQKKMNEYIVPIVNRLKEKRPALYQLYTSKKDNTTNRLYDITGPGAKNKETQELLFKLAKEGKDRPEDKALTYALSSFTRKGTRYPEFAEAIKKLRPDWFDKKLLAKDRSDRFHKRGKYKEKIL